jgi:hypothetical protein
MATITTPTPRNPVAAFITTSRLRARVRPAQEPAATPAETERGTEFLSSPKVRQALVKTWGWD